MKKVLVVNDEEDLRTMVVGALQDEGFRTIEADDGSRAFTLAKDFRPDLIISDVIMDGGNGFLLKEMLRDDERTAAIPLILMTGHALQAGAWQSDPEVEYLAKPFGALELLSAVARKLNPNLHA